MARCARSAAERAPPLHRADRRRVGGKAQDGLSARVEPTEYLVVVERECDFWGAF